MRTFVFVFLAAGIILGAHELYKRRRKAQLFPSSRRTSTSERSFMADRAEMHKLVAFAAAIAGCDGVNQNFIDRAFMISENETQEFTNRFRRCLKRHGLHPEDVRQAGTDYQRMMRELSIDPEFIKLCRSYFAFLSDVRDNIDNLDLWNTLQNSNVLPRADTMAALLNTHPKKF